MAGHGTFSRRHFITSVAAVTGSAVVGSTLASKPAMGFSLKDPVVDTLQHNGKAITAEKVPWKVRPFSIRQVKLGEGPCKLAMEADQKYLRSLPPDRLLHAFRTNAGLPIISPAAWWLGSS